MKVSAKRVGSIIYLLATLVLVVVLATATGGVKDSWYALLRLQPRWLAAAFGCWVAFVLLRSFALKFFCASQNRPISIYCAVRITLIGVYYSGITPAATGGQPMQIYELARCSIAPSIGTSAVWAETFGFQFTHMIIATVLWIIYRAPVRRLLVGVHWIMVGGYAVNIIWTALLALLLIRSGRLIWVAEKIVRFLAKIRLVRDPVKTGDRVKAQAEDFFKVTRMLLKRPALMVAVLLFSSAQVFAYFSILYFVYRGFGWDARSYGLLLTISALMYMSASLAPTPGSSGAQEGGFLLFLRWIFPERSLFPALLVWRFFTYYLMLIAGALTVALGVITSSRKARRTESK